LSRRAAGLSETTGLKQKRRTDMEDLIQQSLDLHGLRRQFGIPHPLSKFAANGKVNDGACADAILGFIQDLKMGDDPDSAQHRAAAWFLFESEKAFFFACAQAGLDANRLRSHLVKCQPGQMEIS
jgi:hypothetical protein